jgi:hypothetical protein
MVRRLLNLEIPAANQPAPTPNAPSRLEETMSFFSLFTKRTAPVAEAPQVAKPVETPRSLSLAGKIVVELYRGPDSMGRYGFTVHKKIDYLPGKEIGMDLVKSTNFLGDPKNHQHDVLIDNRTPK